MLSWGLMMPYTKGVGFDVIFGLKSASHDEIMIRKKEIRHKVFIGLNISVKMGGNLVKNRTMA